MAYICTKPIKEKNVYDFIEYNYVRNISYSTDVITCVAI